MLKFVRLLGGPSAASLLVLVALGWPQSAFAQAILADCTGGNPGALQDTLDGLEKSVAHNVLVRGACGTARAEGFLTLRLFGDQGVPSSLSESVAECGAAPLPVLLARDSKVSIYDLTISGGRGVIVQGGDLLLIRSKIEDSARTGLFLNGGAEAYVSQSEVRNSCWHGIGLIENSIVRVVNGSDINTSRMVGIWLPADGSVTVGGGSVVQDNGSAGIAARTGGFVSIQESTVQYNGGAPDPNFGFSYLQGGVIGDFGSTVFTTDATIRQNAAVGLLADKNSNARIVSTDFVDNGGPGVSVSHQSLASFENADNFPGASMLSGNTPKDLECDGSSIVFGDLSGVAANGCQNANK